MNSYSKHIRTGCEVHVIENGYNIYGESKTVKFSVHLLLVLNIADKL